MTTISIINKWKISIFALRYIYDFLEGRSIMLCSVHYYSIKERCIFIGYILHDWVSDFLNGTYILRVLKSNYMLYRCISPTFFSLVYVTDCSVDASFL